MKLVINYDLIDAIRNVMEPYGALKVIRNNRDAYYKWLSFWTVLDASVCKGNFDYAVMMLGVQASLLLGSDILSDRLTGIDTYATMSTHNLRKLATDLRNLHVMTTYDLLLQSSLYHKKCKITFNESKLPFLKEEKYILVPSYSYSGEVRDTSILQEHEFGTKEYILSTGEYKKEYKKVLVRA